MNEQQYVFNSIFPHLARLHVLIEMLRNGKTFFVKYLAQNFQIEQNNFLLCATIGAIVFTLSSIVSIIHKLLVSIAKAITCTRDIENENFIVMDEMFMMTSYMSCIVEHQSNKPPKTQYTMQFATSFLYCWGPCTITYHMCTLTRIPYYCV